MDECIKKWQQHIESLLNIECKTFDVRLKAFSEHNGYCGNCRGCDFTNTHLYGCYEAARWENKYIYYCPKGFIFIAIALLNDADLLEKGIISGPLIMGDPEDYPCDVRLSCFSTTHVNDMTELMAGIFCKSLPVYMDGTKQFLNEIYTVMQESPVHTYPIVLEKQLQNAIIDGDGKSARELLNKLLGHIFFDSNSDFDVIKSRVVELIVLLSRSAIDGGGDIHQIFALNMDYLKRVEDFQSLERLSMWLTEVINRFINYVFEFHDVKHTDIIFKVIAYIKQHYNEKITLDEIAGHVHLSKSYLSKIFKEEMNCNLTTYVNQIRIEKSKSLLLDDTLSLVDIANMIGFDDQSYFTKVFKNVTGVSPGKYRERHGKI